MDDAARNQAAFFPFPDLQGLPADLEAELEKRRHGHVFRMLMHAPNTAAGFLAMTDAVRTKNSLPPELRELAILRVGRRYDAPYEVHHHERIGRADGMTEAAVAAAASGPGASGITEADRLILELTDEILDRHGLSRASRARALESLSVNQLADLVLLVGHYQQVCNFLTTFEVQI
ncbi:MAG: carboxymuconolactone decarboxylase family protein [Pseudomonadota bacterium]|nr:carboxymuconolactone decarboxylase family protein [Pseudomonadota bacterium]MEE3099744.1 carboxymuconolactone decarboxylase family protein [Pseudomonadota bacterium]